MKMNVMTSHPWLSWRIKALGYVLLISSLTACGPDNNSSSSVGVSITSSSSASSTSSSSSSASSASSSTSSASSSSSSTTSSASSSASSSSSSSSSSVTGVAHSISGTLTGLATGQHVSIKLDANLAANSYRDHETLDLTTDQAFTFSTKVDYQQSINVVVSAQAGGQVCTVSNGHQTAVVADITNLSITCADNGWTVTTIATISGSLSGLTLDNSGSGVGSSLGRLFVSNHNVLSVVDLDNGFSVSTIGDPSGGYLDGSQSTAKFNNPTGLYAVPNVGIFVADFSNNKIRQVSLSYSVSTFSGASTTPGFRDGSSPFYYWPAGICGGSNISPLYVVDTYNNNLRVLDATGAATTIAGYQITGGGYNGYLDGTGQNAMFNLPTACVVSADGSIYVADSNNNLIRNVTTQGVVTTVAGGGGITGLHQKGGLAGATDGSAGDARFSYPAGIIEIPNLGLVVTDKINNTIRLIANGQVTTLAGSGSEHGEVDGAASAARFNAPIGITFDSAGNIYVVDYNNGTSGKIRRLHKN